MLGQRRGVEGHVEAGHLDLGGVVHRRQLFFHVLEFGLPHGLVELLLELVGHLPHAADDLADRAHDARQLLRPDDDERDDADEEYLTGIEEVEHSASSARTALSRAALRPARRSWGVAL